MPASLPHTLPLHTAAAMREADRLTIDAFGVPSFTLMESAGRAAAQCIAAAFAPVAGRRVAVFAGGGNNGGDGLVVARQLVAEGARVHVVHLSAPSDMAEDTAHNFALLDQLAGEEHTPGHLRLTRFESLAQLAGFPPADVHVDALLGTGLASDLREPVRGLVGWMNEQAVPTVALDVPSGLHSDTGRILGDAVRAARTVTNAAPKIGLRLGAGPDMAGAVETVEIGIPTFALERAMQHEPHGCARLTTDAAVRAALPRRPRDAYKYSVGLALVVAGSPGMTGAPVMASKAAARIGAGYVACACPQAAEATLAAKLTAITTVALPPSQQGGIEAKGALQALAERLGKAKALLVGPGLGRAASTQTFVRQLLDEAEQPAVIDADGLNALADIGDPDTVADWIAARAGGRWILTPHAGEFKRLAGPDADLADRVRTAQAYAARWNSVLLLKGTPSIVAAPPEPRREVGRTCLGATGNAALATAGTGDVLAGCCAGLLAQGLPPFEAAVCALHISGAAAERYTQRRALRSMTAPDLIRHLPHVLAERFSPAS